MVGNVQMPQELFSATASVDSGFGSPFQQAGVDVLYILDCSRSMGDKLSPDVKSSKFELAATALMSAISETSRYTDQDRVGIIAANTNIFAKPIVTVIAHLQPLIPLVSGGKIPIGKIMSIRTEGGTAWAPAIRYAVKMLVEAEKRPNNEQQIMIITDSRNNTSDQPVKIIPEAIKHRIKIHVVDLGNRKDKELLKLPSDLTGGQFRMIQTAQELTSRLLSPVLPERRTDELRFVVGQFSSSPLLVPESQTPSTPAMTVQIPPLRKASTSESTEIRDNQLEKRGVSDKTILITPKKKKPKTLEEVEFGLNEVSEEYRAIVSDLKQGKITQAEFSERYSILQFELQELKQSVSELRAKLSREMSEYAFARERDPSEDAYRRESNSHLLELDRQIEALRNSVAPVSLAAS